MSVTPPSSWPWVDHPVSGLRHATDAPCSDSVSLRLPYSVKLATQRKSLTHYTKGTPSPCSIGTSCARHLRFSCGQLSRVTARRYAPAPSTLSATRTPTANANRHFDCVRILGQADLLQHCFVLLRRVAARRSAKELKTN